MTNFQAWEQQNLAKFAKEANKKLLAQQKEIEQLIERRVERMNLNQGKVAQHLVDDLLDKIHKYDETLYMSTVIGVLEIVKQQLINDSLDTTTPPQRT